MPKEGPCQFRLGTEFSTIWQKALFHGFLQYRFRAGTGPHLFLENDHLQNSGRCQGHPESHLEPVRPKGVFACLLAVCFLGQYLLW
jgi:hypothetical protein